MPDEELPVLTLQGIGRGRVRAPEPPLCGPLARPAAPLTCTAAPSSSRRTPSSSSTASSAGHKPQGLAGGRGGDAGRRVGGGYLRRGQTPGPEGPGVPTGSAAAAPPEGAEGAMRRASLWGLPARPPAPRPHLVEVPQAAPQVVQVPHPTGCRVTLAPDRPRAPSGARGTVGTGGHWLERDSRAHLPSARPRPRPQAPPTSPSLPLPSPQNLRPLPYMMPSTRRSRAPSLRRRNLFSGQRGPSPSCSSSSSGSSASPTSPASPSACGEQGAVSWPR